MNVADLQACFEDLLQSLERVNRKLDLEVRLRDLVTDQSDRMKKVQEDVIRFQDNLQKRLQDLRQMYNVHDDRLSRFLEVTQSLETENKQLRRAIREYERLAQTSPGHNKEMLPGLGQGVDRRLDGREGAHRAPGAPAEDALAVERAGGWGEHGSAGGLVGGAQRQLRGVVDIRELRRAKVI